MDILPRSFCSGIDLSARTDRKSNTALLSLGREAELNRMQMNLGAHLYVLIIFHPPGSKRLWCGHSVINNSHHNDMIKDVFTKTFISTQLQK